MLARQGKFAEAQTAFDLTLKTWPGYVRVLICRGMVRQKLGDYRGAGGLRPGAPELSQDYASFLRRGYVKHASGDQRGAIAEFDGAEASPEYAAAYLGRATARLALDDSRGALADLDVAAAQAVAEAERQDANPAGRAGAHHGRHARGYRRGRHQQHVRLPGPKRSA